MFYRRAWLWDVAKEHWVKFFDGVSQTHFPPGLYAPKTDPHPFIIEQWWAWQNGQWVDDGTLLNWPPYIID